MEIKYKKSTSILTVYVYGELDECSASTAKEILDKVIFDNINVKKVVFDLSGLSFMDSTGVGVLIGRYKKMKDYSVPIYISNPSTHAEKIFKMTGLYDIMPKIS